MAEVVALSTGISLKLLDFESIGVAMEWAKQDSRLAYLGIFDTSKQKIAVFDPNKLNLDVETLLKRRGHFEQDHNILHCLCDRLSSVAVGVLREWGAFTGHLG